MATLRKGPIGKRRARPVTVADVPLSLHVLVEKEGTTYFAHVLEFDLIAEAPTLAALNSAVQDLVEAHLAYAREHNLLPTLFRPAPPEYWRKYSKGLATAHIKPKLEAVHL